MTKLTTLDLTPLYRQTIGLDRVFDRLIAQIDSAQNAQTYPPYDIIKTGENTFEVRVAVAGFNPGEVDITVKDGNLVITGEKFVDEEAPTTEYLHHGISNRRFIRSFQLADKVEVVGAVSKNGILTVQLERQLPEELQPKSIAISYQS